MGRGSGLDLRSVFGVDVKGRAYERVAARAPAAFRRTLCVRRAGPHGHRQGRLRRPRPRSIGSGESRLLGSPSRARKAHHFTARLLDDPGAGREETKTHWNRIGQNAHDLPQATLGASCPARARANRVSRRPKRRRRRWARRGTEFSRSGQRRANASQLRRSGSRGFGRRLGR
jgi:hypothetical protein